MIIMIKFILNLSVLILLMGMVSCSSSRFVVAPPFTSVNNISNLKTGQTFEEVNQVLGIPAYDILYSSGKDFLCFYNYRILDRKINIDAPSAHNTLMSTVHEESLSSEKAQITGEAFYSEWRRVYINFKDGKVSHYITNAGLQGANYIALINGTIKLLNEKPVEYSHFSKNSQNTQLGFIQNPTSTSTTTSKPNLNGVIDPQCSICGVDVIDNILKLESDGRFDKEPFTRNSSRRFNILKFKK